MQREFVSDDNDVTNQRLIESLKSIPVKDLIGFAIGAREHSYSPYSEYAVGACVLTADGKAFTGCNIENASYGATVCAERAAIFKAVSEGYKELKAIAIVGGKTGRKVDDFAHPCGMCRQVMREFSSPDDFIVIVAKSETDYKVYALSELLPESFGPEKL